VLRHPRLERLRLQVAPEDAAPGSAEPGAAYRCVSAQVPSTEQALPPPPPLVVLTPIDMLAILRPKQARGYGPLPVGEPGLAAPWGLRSSRKETA
jgi:hypothetical protein